MSVLTPLWTPRAIRAMVPPHHVDVCWHTHKKVGITLARAAIGLGRSYCTTKECHAYRIDRYLHLVDSLGGHDRPAPSSCRHAIGHYDGPLPDHIYDLNVMRQEDRFRFANNLRAWIEVDDGCVVDFGYAGGSMIGSTTLALGLGSITIPAVPFPHIRHEPIVTARRLHWHEVDRPLD